MNNTEIMRDIRRYRQRLEKARSIKEFWVLKLPDADHHYADDRWVADHLDDRCDETLKTALLRKSIEDEIRHYALMLMRDVNSERLARMAS